MILITVNPTQPSALQYQRMTKTIHVYYCIRKHNFKLERLEKGIFITKWSNLHSANSNNFHGEQTHTQTSPTIRHQTAQHSRENGVSVEAAERKHCTCGSYMQVIKALRHAVLSALFYNLSSSIVSCMSRSIEAGYIRHC